jgi:hypothetical protein
LARQAESGDAYCSTMTSALVVEPELDPAWDGTEFFDISDDDEEGEVRCANPASPGND